MNFVCDRCKQKYHVADEKLRGRAVTRFRCKKCEHVIELDLAASESPTVEAPTVAAPTAPRPAARPIGTAPIARPRSATMVGSAAAKPVPRPRAATVTGAAVGAAMGAAARPMAKSAAERSTSAILNASENGWYAGIRDLPVGPLTRKELLAKVQSGDVSADTLVWREGLDDWRPLRNVAELGDMLRVGAQKLSGDLLDEMGKRPAPPRSARVVPISTARGGPARPAVHDEDEEATRVTGLDPAIAAMAAKALSRATSPPAVEGDAEDETLVARQRAGAAPIAPAAKLSVDDLAHGPTVDTSSERPPPPEPLAALDRPAARSSPATTSSLPPAAPAARSVPPPPAAAGDFGLDDLPENLFAAAPKVDPAALAPPNASTVNLGGAGLATPSLAPVAMPAPQPAPAPMAMSMPAPAPQPRGGLSMPVIVLIGGVLVAGMGMGIYIGRQNNPTSVPAAPQPPAAAPVTPPAPPAPPAPTVGETVALTAPAAAPETPPEVNPTTAPEAPPEQVTPEQVNPSGSHTSRSHSPSRTAQPAQRTLTAAEAAALRELGAQPSASAGGPVGNTQLRATPPRATSGANTTNESNPARANRAIRAFQDSRVANNCWQQVLRQNPALRSGAVTISFTVTPAGRFANMDVTNSPDPRFTQCIRSRSGGIAPLGGGGEVNAQVSVNLTAN